MQKITEGVTLHAPESRADAQRTNDREWAKTSIFVSVFLLTALVLSFADYLFVRLVDPYGDFGAGRFPIVLLDSRREKMDLFRRPGVASHVTGLVLGSSRSMLLKQQLLDTEFGERFFNFAVDNGHVEDYLAVYRWALRQGAPLRMLVIGLDVVAMHPDNIPDHMFERNEALRSCLDDPSPAYAGPFHAAFSDSLQRLKEPFTAEYLKDSVKSITIAFRNTRPTRGFEPDGYEDGARSGTPISRATIDLNQPIAADQVATYIDRFKGMNELSGKRRGYLETLVAESRVRGVRTVIWLTPVHPRLMLAIETTTNHSHLLQLTRQYLKELHEQFGAIVYDFSDIRTFGGTATDWTDNTHMAAENMNRVVLSLRKEDY